MTEEDRKKDLKYLLYRHEYLKNRLEEETRKNALNERKLAEYEKKIGEFNKLKWYQKLNTSSNGKLNTGKGKGIRTRIPYQR